VFGFCASLFECLTGERPFPGETLLALRDAIEQRRMRKLPWPRVPAALRRLIQKGLSALASDRYQAMAPLLAELRRIRSAPRRRLVLAVAAAGIAAAAVLSVRRGGGWHAEVVALPGAYEENASYPVLSPDGTQMAYFSDRGDRKLWRL